MNVRDAAPEVIASLPDMTPDRLNGIFSGHDPGVSTGGQSLADVAGTGSEDAANDASNAFRVEVRVAFDDGRRAACEVVIILGDDDVATTVVGRNGIEAALNGTSGPV